jgi:hypothetical protein
VTKPRKYSSYHNCRECQKLTPEQCIEILEARGKIKPDDSNKEVKEKMRKSVRETAAATKVQMYQEGTSHQRERENG